MAKEIAVYEDYKKVCNCWKDLYKAYNYFYKKPKTKYKWIFRGENYRDKNKDSKKLKTALKSSLDNAFKRFGLANKDRSEIEKKHVREFQRKAHLYSADRSANLLESLALLRHYEGPARMLDWSYSFFVAIYWAVARAKANDNLAVWALNNKWLGERNYKFEKELIDRQIQLLSEKHMKDLPGKKKLVKNVKKELVKSHKYKDFEQFLRGKTYAAKDIKEYSFYKELLYDPTDLSNKGLYDLMYHPQAKDFIYAVNPYYLNERLSIQQGVLLVQGNIKKSWGTNLKNMIEEREKTEQEYGTLLWKISIKLDIKGLKEVLSRLYSMNISQATLFPDLGGFAQSLTNRIALDF